MRKTLEATGNPGKLRFFVLIVAIADLHGDTRHAEAVRSDIIAADLLVIAGDLTGFGQPHVDTLEVIEQVVSSVGADAARVLAIPGNCDLPDVGKYLRNQQMNLDGQTVEIGALSIVGLGGSLPCPSETPYEMTELELEGHLRDLASSLPSTDPFILVSHQPPQNTSVDLALNGKHVGSVAVRRFIEEHSPIVCVTGHIHEGRGIDSIGETILV